MTERRLVEGLAPDELRANSRVTDVVVTELLTTSECEQVLGAITPDGWAEDRAKSVQSAGRSKRGQALPDVVREWIGPRLVERVGALNDLTWQFEIAGLEDPVRLYLYEGSDGGYIAAHSDLSARRSTRKLTFSVLLSPPDEFDGGDLVLLSGPVDGARTRGALTVFPSFTLHQVTPVTSGRRVAIVGWVIGPVFA